MNFFMIIFQYLKISENEKDPLSVGFAFSDQYEQNQKYDKNLADVYDKLQQFKNSADSLENEIMKPYSNYKLYNMIKEQVPNKRLNRNLSHLKEKTDRINRLATDSQISYDSRIMM